MTAIQRNMAGTPRAELAASARPQQLKTALLDLSKNWERLAIDLENGVVMFDDVEVVAEVRQPLDSKQLSENREVSN